MTDETKEEAKPAKKAKEFDPNDLINYVKADGKKKIKINGYPATIAAAEALGWKAAK